MLRDRENQMQRLSTATAIMTIAFGLSGLAASAAPMHQRMADPPGVGDPGPRILGITYISDSNRVSDGNCLGRHGGAIAGGFADPNADPRVGMYCRY